MNRSRRYEAAAVALLLGLGAMQLGIAANEDASVGDEHPHILSGWLYAQCGRFSGGLDNPPLGQLLVAAPLVLFRIPYRYASDDGLLACRAVVILCALGLALLLWRWARAAGGRRAGCLALAIWNLEPNLLAHGHLATLDLPLTFAWWSALWIWRDVLDRRRGREARRLLFFGAIFAVAAMVKFTGFLLWPAALAVALVAAHDAATRRRAAGALLLALPWLFLAAHVAYAFEPTRFGWPEHLWSAIRGKAEHRTEVHFAYMAQRRSDHGFLEYYLVALLLKTPLPLWGLALVGLRRVRRMDAALWLLPAALIVVAFSAVRVNIGVRHVLPVYPALVLLAALGVDRLLAHGRLVRLVLVLVASTWLVGHARTAPQYLPYFNLLAGGSAGGHRWLLDSNLDWGQDDRRITDFLQCDAMGYEVNPAPQPARPGRFAVSSNALHNLQRRDATPYDWLRGFAPHDFAGRSWRLYVLESRDFQARAGAAPGDVLAQIAWAEVDPAGDGFESVAARFPDDERVPERAARAALARGDRAAASTWVRRGLARHGDHTRLRILEERLRLEAARAAARGGAEEMQARLELALFRAEFGELDSVRAELEDLARAEPRNLEAQRAWGIALARAGDFESAVRFMAQSPVTAYLADEIAVCRGVLATERALQYGGVIPLPQLHELGRTHFESGRYARAAPAYARILEQDPANGLAIAYLGEMQVRSKLRIVPDRLAPLAIRVAAPR